MGTRLLLLWGWVDFAPSLFCPFPYFSYHEPLVPSPIPQIQCSLSPQSLAICSQSTLWREGSFIPHVREMSHPPGDVLC